ncbi:MAG: iron(II)-dependent oxidoreductase [Alphaproteobacteria bacterium]|jgi:iron(II)-dependent oxidoreductase
MTKPVDTQTLIAMLRSTRKRTLELIEGLTQEQLIGPKLPTVNPMIWEIGHVAWFYENFILRRHLGHDPLLARGDELYDSIAIAHESRWDLPIYPMNEMRDYMARVLDTIIDHLGDGLADERESYLYQFTVFHEDMHCEAYTWARQTHGYPTPLFDRDGPAPTAPTKGDLVGDAAIPGGVFNLGSQPDSAFLFDNEKWAHDVEVAPFHMARAPVTNREYAAFVNDGGYEKEALWSPEAWRWRNENAADHPLYWRRKDGDWGSRYFDQWRTLAPDAPVIHVGWYEANAYCQWAGRRLPREAEWEFAATMRPNSTGALQKYDYPWGDGDPAADQANLDGYAMGCVDVAAHASGDNPWGCRQLIGNIWEWTNDTFAPFGGFAPDDYKEYSQPLFGDTKVLRGGAWTTRNRLINARHRNYFGPDRRDVFAGFRTCALD